MGGHNLLPMKELRSLLADLGYGNIRTYIQSGNCVFHSSERKASRIEKRVGEAIEKRFGFHPRIFAMTVDELDAAIAANPYPQGYEDPKSVHIFFLSEPAVNADLDALQPLRKGAEDFALTDSAFYLYAPDGIGRSKLAAKIERYVPVQMTGRNFRSVLKIAALASSR